MIWFEKFHFNFIQGDGLTYCFNGQNLSKKIQFRPGIWRVIQTCQIHKNVKFSTPNKIRAISFKFPSGDFFFSILIRDLASYTQNPRVVQNCGNALWRVMHKIRVLQFMAEMFFFSLSFEH